MATSYTGLRVQDTYNAIIKIGDNSNLTATPKLLSDGLGNDSPLYLSGTRLGIGISPAYQFHTSGNAKIGGNLIVSGNLTVNGTLTYLNVQDLAVEDPIIKLAKDNTANTLDIGLFGKYVATGTKYKGFFNDASDDKFKLFIGTTVEPTTTVDTSATGYTVGTLVANLEGNVTGNVTGNLTGNVTGNVTGTVSSLSNHTTTNLTEGTNLYYTNARADARVNLQTGANLDLSSKDTDDLSEGTTNLYYTNARFDTRFTSKDTDDLSEGTTNLYFTTARARASFSAGDGITITNGVIASEGGSADTAKRIEITVKNVSGSDLVKGAAVHASPTATPPSGNVIEVIGADNDVTASMPAIGILNEAIADEAEGQCVMVGSVTGINTSSFTAGQELYVGSTAGVLTNTKPTSTSNQIQKIAVVIKSHASNGQIEVFGAGRANDVPNLVNRTITFDPSINVTSSSGLGRIELGGATGGYIDLKAPASDDYDMRFIVSQGGNEITTASGDLKINTSNTLALTLDTSQNATFASDINITNDILPVNTGASDLGTDAKRFGSLFTNGAFIGTLTSTNIQLQGDLKILNKAQSAYIGFATKNTSGSETVMDITNAGSATFAGSITGTSANLTTSGTVLSLDRTGGATALVELKIGGTVEGYLGATSTKSLVVFNQSAAEKFSVSNAGDGTFAGNIEMKSDASNNTKFLRIWNEGTATNDDAVLTWQTQASRTYSMGIHRDSGNLVISSADASVASLELITINTSGNATFAGNVTADSFIKDGGTSSQYLMADGSVSTGGTGVDGSGTANDVAMWSDSDTLTDAPIAISGNNATFVGDVNITRSSTGQILSRVWNSNTGGNGTAVIRIANSGNQANGARLEFSDESYYNATVSVDRTNGMRFMVHDDSTSMSDLLTHTALTLATNKNATFGGNVSFSQTSTFGNNASITHYTNGYMYIRGGTNGIVVGDNVSSTRALFSGSHFITWEINGSAAMHMDSSSRLGIGTTSPSARLDVRRGDADGLIAEFHQNAGYGIDIGSSQSDAYISSGYTQNFIFKTNAGSGQLERMRITSAGAIEIKGTSTTSQAQAFITNDNSVLSIGSSVSGSVVKDIQFNSPSPMMYIDGSTARVGIGTTSPNAKLHLGGTAPGDSIIRQDATTSGTNWEIGERVAGKWQIFEDDGDSIVATFMSTGRVGIGTESPNAKLDIKGAGGGTGLSLQTTDASSNQTFYIYDGGRVGVRYWPLTVGLPSSTSAASNAAFQVKVNNDFTVLTSGFVGIGTDTPLALLSLTQANGANIRFTNSITGRYFTIGEGVGTNDKFSFRGNSYRSTDTLTVDFANNRVGINTISPDSKLDVKGPSATPADGNQTISITNTTGGTQLNLGTIENTGGWIEARESSTLRNLLLNPNGGNVGIGTTSPTSKLQVANAGEVIVRSSMTAADGYRGGFEADNQHTGGTIWSMFSTNNSDGYFGGGKYVIANESMGGVDANTTAKFVIDGSGNVGIGTTSPGRGLTIDKSNANAALEIIKNNTGNQIVYLGTGSSAGTDDPLLRMYHNTTENIRLYTTGDSWINGGNLGIGTTSPSYKLHVNGSAQVDGTLYSDRVAAGIPMPSHIVDSYSSTSGVFAGRFVYAGTSGSDCAMLLRLAGGSTAPSYVDFIYGSVQTGYITTNGSSTFYGSASDYRLKENVVELNGALDRLDNLQPKRFNFTLTPEQTVDGFLAHEVADVVPEAIHGQKDAVNEDNEIIAQGIDQAKLVPLLVAAVQELRAEVKLLKSQINS